MNTKFCCFLSTQEERKDNRTRKYKCLCISGFKPGCWPNIRISFIPIEGFLVGEENQQGRSLWSNIRITFIPVCFLFVKNTIEGESWWRTLTRADPTKTERHRLSFPSQLAGPYRQLQMVDDVFGDTTGHQVRQSLPAMSTHSNHVGFDLFCKMDDAI